MEQKQVEQKQVEQKPVEQKPVEQKPVEQEPVEQKPVEQCERDRALDQAIIQVCRLVMSVLSDLEWNEEKIGPERVIYLITKATQAGVLATRANRYLVEARFIETNNPDKAKAIAHLNKLKKQFAQLHTGPKAPSPFKFAKL
jgi:hypothetical protein